MQLTRLRAFTVEARFRPPFSRVVLQAVTKLELQSCHQLMGCSSHKQVVVGKYPERCQDLVGLEVRAFAYSMLRPPCRSLVVAFLHFSLGIESPTVSIPSVELGLD